MALLFFLGFRGLLLTLAHISVEFDFPIFDSGLIFNYLPAVDYRSGVRDDSSSGSNHVEMNNPKGRYSLSDRYSDKRSN